MKLSTLVEVRRCFGLLREAESRSERINVEQFMDCLKVYSKFHFLVEELLEKEVEIEKDVT